MRAPRVLIALLLAALPLLAFLPSGMRWRAAGEPLWDQVRASELVVLADVIEVSDDCSNMPEGTDRVAHLRVLEAWKGQAPGLLQVPFNDYLLWPPPPRYRPGETVVAFLRRDGRSWTTVGMGAGALEPTPSAISELRARVRRLVAMQAEA
ncbi:MAG: hypothetical protein ACREAA_08055 [Candidatus Polarisedimenticolia bacterium]